MPPTARRIFFSYAHESDEHRNRVLQLCGQFRQSGLDAWIDQYETFPPQGWPIWMQNQIRRADFVLIVCSQTYRRRFEGEEIKGKGKGAKWEGSILTQALYDAEQENRKFIPIVIDPADISYIPVALRSFTHFNVSDQLALESLYRLLTDQPSVVPPPLGNIQQLMPLEHATKPIIAGQNQPRVQAKLSFASFSGGWTILLKVANVSDIPLYLENPELILALPQEQDDTLPPELPAELCEESISTQLFPVKPFSGPLLPTQVRVYFLDPSSLSFLRSDEKWLTAKPAIRIATAVADELRLEDRDTAEQIQMLLGVPAKHGTDRQYEVRMPLIMGLVHKRCSDQSHTGYRVYPPRELLDDPSLATRDDAVERLWDKRFRVEFQDGTTEVLTMPELMVFTEQLILIAVQMQTILGQLDKAGVNQPVRASVNANISVERAMHPKAVKVLLSKISFESVPFEESNGTKSPKGKAAPKKDGRRLRKATKKKVAGGRGQPKRRRKQSDNSDR
jgi:hypothetical protein